MFRLGYTVTIGKDGKPTTPPPWFPLSVPGMKLFVSLGKAEAYRDKVSNATGNTYHIIAFQVDPQVNGGIGWRFKPGREREDGEVFHDELTGNKFPDGSPTDAFNFSTLLIVDGLVFWEWMNHKFKCPTGDNKNPDTLMHRWNMSSIQFCQSHMERQSILSHP